MNKIQLTGRLAQDPTYRTLPGNDRKHVTELRLAVKGMGSGNRDAAGYIDVVSYTMTEKARPDARHRLARRGRCRIGHQTWEQNGQKRGKHRVVAGRRVPRRPPQRRPGARHRRLRARRRGRRHPFLTSRFRLRSAGHAGSTLRLRPSRQQPRRPLERRHPLPSLSLAFEDRRDLLAVFDDGRDTPYGYCACLRLAPGAPHTSSDLPHP
jgi:Single-strand binding protein family